MKITIPVNENNSGSSVLASFGRAPYFLFHDTESGTSAFVRNTAADAQSGAGLKAAQIVVDHGTDAVVAMSCGQNAADVLTAARIWIYKAKNIGIEANLAAFEAGDLAEMTQFHAGFHGGHE